MPLTRPYRFWRVALVIVGIASVAFAQDADTDGVGDTVDVCCDTPPGLAVDSEGRPLGDLDGDCDVDLHDFSILQGNSSGALASAGPCVSPCKSDGECDDGSYCNGAETCDTESAVCVEGSLPCAGGQICDEDQGECIDAECLNDVDCDDGIACNGAESCNGGTCAPGQPPCEPCSETCGEDSAGVTCHPVGDLDLTLRIDNVLVTPCDDFIEAPLLFNAPTGTLIPTLQSGDYVYGSAGRDELFATLPGGNATIVPFLDGVEVLTIRNLGSIGAATKVSINASNVYGLREMNLVESTYGDVRIINLLERVDFGIRGFDDSSVDFEAWFLNPAITVGDDDSVTITLLNARAGRVSIPPGGFETVVVVSQGTMPNRLSAIEIGTAPVRLLIVGTQPFSLNGNPMLTPNVDASGFHAGLTLALSTQTEFAAGVLVQCGAGDDVISVNIFNSSSSGGTNIQLGDGDDVSTGHNVGIQMVDAGSGDDVVSGGSGNDLYTLGPGLDTIRMNTNCCVSLDGVDSVMDFEVDDRIQANKPFPPLVGAGFDVVVDNATNIANNGVDTRIVFDLDGILSGTVPLRIVLLGVQLGPDDFVTDGNFLVRTK
ncbi:MAG: calcium-binding protein [Phycisphaerales bacterium]|nr:calcium-binding protein [Phycisphaerales bacterium]